LSFNIDRNNWGCATSRAFREVACRTADTVRLRFTRPEVGSSSSALPTHSLLPDLPRPGSRRGNCSSARVPGRPPNRRVAHVLRFSRRGFTDCMRRILYRPPIFHHIQPVTTITDIPLAMLENEDLIGQGRSVSVSRDGLRCRPAAIISAP
jgi:hypothetical protein